MSTTDPILIADNARGIYAIQHAAKTLLSQMKDSLYVIRDGSTDDVRTVANVSPTADLDDDQQAAYDAAVDAFMESTWERTGYGVRMCLWTGPSGDLFLIDVNSDPDNDESTNA